MSNIFVNRSSCKNIAHIFLKNKKITCAVGKNGIGIKKKEGDLVTPKGIFKVVKIFYRSDKLKKVRSGIPIVEIQKKYKWCTDPRSHYYNSLLTKRINCVYEDLYRNDDLYDLVLVLNYNLTKLNTKGVQYLFTADQKRNLLKVAWQLEKKIFCSLLKD